MKRFGLVACMFFACHLLTGCGSDTHEGLVQQTIQNMRKAATEIGIITAKVKEATEDAKKSNKKLDLTAAKKAAEQLKVTGQETVNIKQRIDVVKSRITEQEKSEYAENNRGALNEAFKTLLTQKEALRKALTEAEALDKRKVDDLRKTIEEAESPFEAQAR